MNHAKFGCMLALALFGSCCPARADCLLPPFELLWSYPANGQKDVPLNASLWVLANFGEFTPRASASLNGRDIKRLESDERNAKLGLTAFAPTLLEPDTSYTLRVSYEPSAGQPAKSVELHFTTGTERRELPSEQRVAGRQRRAGAFVEDHPCRKIIMAPGCLDAPEPGVGLHTLEVAQGDTIGWHVKADGPDGPRFWPSACGNPVLALRDIEGSRCFELQAVAVGGATMPSKRYCVREKASKVPFDRASAPNYVVPPRALDARADASSSRAQPTAAERDDGGADRAAHKGCGGCSPTHGVSASALLLLATHRRRRR